MRSVCGVLEWSKDVEYQLANEVQYYIWVMGAILDIIKECGLVKFVPVAARLFCRPGLKLNFVLKIILATTRAPFRALPVSILFQGATIKAEESTGRILIARVMHGGAADRSGLISVGDEVRKGIYLLSFITLEDVHLSKSTMDEVH